MTGSKGMLALATGAVALAALAAGATAQQPTTDTPAFWGEPSVDAGKCCRTLGEVRENIDRIDHALVSLMAERGRYVHEAARFKRDPAAVEDKGRVESIIRKVRALATENRLDPEVADATYRTMIAGFTVDEQRVAGELMRTKAK